MNLPDPSIFTRGRTSEKYIAKHYAEFYEYLLDNYPVDINFIEKLYWYVHNINNYPLCPICHKRVNFIGFSKGYYKYCSLKCSNNSPEVKIKKNNTIINNCGSIEESYKKRSKTTQDTLISKYGSIEESYKIRSEKAKQTNLERYGVESIMGTQEFVENTRDTLISKYGSIEESYKIRLEKAKQTNLERYGVEYSLLNNDVREKAKQTNLERYGVENVMQNKSIQDKVKQTNLKRYGVECTFHNKHQQEKTMTTMLEKYGVKFPQQNECILKKSLKTKSSHIIHKHNDIINVNFNNNLTTYLCQCPHDSCTKCMDKTYTCSSLCYYNRRYKNLEVCTNLLPEQKYRSKNTSLEIFVINILDKYNIKYLQNVRDIINGELDIYIPSKQLAIECNGCYWHSDINKTNNYHINKYKNCFEKNIQLLSIWEDQIIHNPDIIESIILSKLGIYQNKIYARKCIIKEISSKESNEFLEANHLQGNTHSSIKLGLFYNNELVSVMTFGKNRKSLNANTNDNNSYELYRFCNKKYTTVIGGASKLLNYFIIKYNPHKLISFSSNDISNGDIYYKLGFDKINESQSYWYIDSKTMTRYHSYKFRKSELIKMGYSNDISEREIMREMKYLKIFDSGQTKFELKFNKKS